MDLADGKILQEQLAAYAHEAWSGWMRHFFGKCAEDEHGNLICPAGYVQAIRRQIALPYDELSEDEKNLDRREAVRMSLLFASWLDTAMDEITNNLEEPMAPFLSEEGIDICEADE